MPKEYSHWYLAERVRMRLGPGMIGQLLGRYRPLYLLGAIIPDSPYYTFMNRRIRSAAESLHQPGDSRFACGYALVQAQAEQWNEWIVAFLLGIYTHLYADSVFHPLVYHFCGNRGRARHRRLEAWLDLAFMGCEGWDIPRPLPEMLQQCTALVGDWPEWVAAFFTPLDALPEGQLQHILNRHARYQKRFADRWWQMGAALLSRVPIRFFREAAALFYPRSGPLTPDLEAPISYRHPVSGDECQESLATLEERMWQHMQRPLVFCGAYLHDPIHLAEAIAALPVPNLATGLEGFGTVDMKWFQTDIPVFGIIPQKPVGSN